jgi:hypothetical protein
LQLLLPICLVFQCREQSQKKLYGPFNIDWAVFFDNATWMCSFSLKRLFNNIHAGLGGQPQTYNCVFRGLATSTQRGYCVRGDILKF